MTYETDERLKGHLDTNQQTRERLCLAVLATDKRFSDVRPRHPQGGPDKGRDIEARFQGQHQTFAAVGFVVQANDSAPQKTQVRRKFKADLQSALVEQPDLKVFVFFTNVRLTASERQTLVRDAIARGLQFCDVFDRERIRIALDSADGLAARFQYLGLSLSDAEQASFFAKWGDDIQSVISSGFVRLETALAQILFTQEANNPLDFFGAQCDLDRAYEASEIGHFRLFFMFHRQDIAKGIFGIMFGASDRSSRMRGDLKADYLQDAPGISAGISTGQWIQVIDDLDEKPETKAIRVKKSKKGFDWQDWGCGGGIGQNPVSSIFIRYSRGGFFQVPPYIRMKDLDGGNFILMANKAFAGKVRRIQLFANDYKLKDITARDLQVDASDFEPSIPVAFTSDELQDSWVRIRPSDFASVFALSFSTETPVRRYGARQIAPPDPAPQI